MAQTRADPGVPAATASGFPRKAFISYSHTADAVLAPKIRAALEAFARPWYRRRSMSVFLDQFSLPVDSKLSSAIESELRRSEYFLLFASPEAAASHWVRKEVEYWLDHRDRENMLIVLTGGELVWDDAAGQFDPTRTTAWPREVEYPFPDPPLWVDLREFRGERAAEELSLRNPAFTDRVATIASKLWGRSKDDLIGDDLRQHRRTRRTAWAAAVLLAALTAASVLAAVTAVRNQREAERRGSIARSRQLAVESERLRGGSRPELALLLALEAVAAQPTIEARRALFEALTAEPQLRRVLKPDVGYSAEGEGLAFSPDGTLLATAGNRYPVVLWDVERGRSLAPALRGNLDNVRAVDFSPDGRRVAGAGDEGVLLWDVASRVQLGPLLAHPLGVRALAFAPDGRTLATGGCAARASGACVGGEVRLWSLADFRELGPPLVGHAGRVQALGFSADGRLLASGGSDGTVVVWDLTAHRAAGEPLQVGIGELGSVAFTPDAEILAVVGRDGRFVRWRTADRAALDEPQTLYRAPLISLFSSHSGRLSGFSFGDEAPLPAELGGTAWAAHDTLLATVRADGSVLLVGTLSSRFPEEEWEGPGGGYHGALTPPPSSWAAPEGGLMASLGADGRLFLWEIGAREPRDSLDTQIEEINLVVIAPGGDRLAVAGCAEHGEPPRVRGALPACVRSRVGVWKTGAREPIAEPFSDHAAPVLAMRFVSGVDRLASYGADGSRSVRVLRSGELRRQDPPEPDLELAAFAASVDGRRVAAAERDRAPGFHRLVIWDQAQRSEARVRVWKRADPVSSLAIHPVDGSVIIGGGVVEVWDPESQVPIAARSFPRTTTYAVGAVAVSPDGTLLASEADRGVVIWDLDSRQRLMEVGNGSRPLVFSADGTRLLAGTALVDLDPAFWRRRACEIANRNLTWREWDLYLGEEEYRRSCEEIELDPDDLVDRAHALAAEGVPARGQKVLAEAIRLAEERGADVNDRICRTGGLLGFGALVLPACDRALAQCDRWECSTMHEHRAVARALAGDHAGAADDLRARTDALRRANAVAWREEIAARLGWIRTLEQGRNPFDAPTRADLRFQYSW